MSETAKNGMKWLTMCVALLALALALYALLADPTKGLKTDVDALAASVASLRGEVAALKTTVAGQATQIDRLSSSVAALENVTRPLADLIAFLKERFPELEI